MKIFNLLFSICCLSSSLFASDYIWPAYEKTVIPEEFKKEKAVYLMYVQTYNFGQYGESYFNNFQRIYINSQEGVNSYANREIELPISGKIVQLTGRVIKSTGEIIDLNEKKIIISKVTTGKKYNDQLYRLASIIYPNVQVGDVLDLVFDVDFDGYVYSETMFLAKELPVLHSKITIRNNSDLDISAFAINGLPKIVSSKDNIGPFFTSEQHNLPAVSNGNFSAIHPETPKLIFNLWSRGEKLDYNVVYAYFYREYFSKYATFGKFNYALKENGILTDEDGNDKFMAAVKLVNHLNQDLTFDDKINHRNSDKLESYYLEKRINSSVFMGLLENFFIEWGINYDDCRTSSLRNGKFDAGIVALDQLDKRFFMLEDKDGNNHYIFPPTKNGSTYFVDEIPYNYEGNSAIGWRGNEGTLESVVGIILPESSEKETQQLSNLQISISALSPYISTIKRQDKFSGHYSPIVRSKDKSDLKTELNFSPKDTVPSSINPVFPYQTEFRGDWIDSNLVLELDENLKMLDLSNLFPENVFYEGESEDEYSGYTLLPFRKNQQFRFFIQSDLPLKMEEKKELSKVENEVGSCSYDVDQIGENAFKIICNLKIKKRVLATEKDLKDYMEIISFYYTMKGKKWVFSI